MQSASPAPARPPVQRGKRGPIVHVSIPSWILGTLVVGLVVLAFVLGWLLPLRSPLEFANAPGPRAKSVVDAQFGHLELTKMTLAPPPEYIEDVSLAPGPRKWIFPAKREDVEKFIVESGLSPEQQHELWSTHSSENPNAQMFAPSDEFVLKLSKEARKKLYVWLGEDDRNAEIINAYRYVGESIDEWLRPAETSPEVVNLIKSLAFQNGPIWLFADLRLVLPKVASDEERRRLIRALTSDETYLVRLRLDENSNVKEIADYWGRGGRVNSILPLLESLSRFPGGEVNTIRSFLPPFAQTHLFTYPVPSPRPFEQQRDCHWTSFNFFNDAPSDGLAANIGNVEIEILANYVKVFDKFLLGDVILFVDKSKTEGNVFHSAVYITKELVFTKNGRRPSNPWMFMKLEEMKSYYPRTGEIDLMYFRKRELSAN